MPIKPLLMSALATALNRYLSLADNRGELLAALAGKTIAVTVQPFDETFFLCPTPDSIQLLDTCLQPADTRLTGSLFALGMMGLSAYPMRSIFSGAVTIEGDMRTGRKLQELFARLDINLEPKLALLIGDGYARRIAGLFHGGYDWSRETFATLGLNLTEFLQEETRELPAAQEIDIFYRRIDALRTDYDRLQSRVERLQQHLNAATTDVLPASEQGTQ